MAGYVGRRLLQAVPVLVLVVLAVFLAGHALPGDPVSALAGEQRALPEETRRALVRRYGLDRPLAHQFLAYLGRLVQGDLGESIRLRRPVADLLAETLPRSARLGLLALLFQVPLALAVGLWAGHRRGAGEAVLRVSVVGLAALPTFVLATLAQDLLGVRWRVLPVAGVGEGLRSYLLPALVLAVASFAYLAWVTRASLLEALGQDHVLVARAKGLAPWPLTVRHGLRNALVPVVTVLGVELGALLGGVVVVETVFNLPGAGRALVAGVAGRDHPVVLAFSLVAAVSFLLANLAVDLLYAVLDPRIRHRG